jgi:hypothetical protein
MAYETVSLSVLALLIIAKCHEPIYNPNHVKPKN